MQPIQSEMIKQTMNCNFRQSTNAIFETGLQFFNRSLSRASDFTSSFTIALLKVIGKSPCLNLFTIATRRGMRRPTVFIKRSVGQESRLTCL